MFATAEESHAHSRETLEEFCYHIEFLRSIKRVCDIGCGKEQLDINYWLL